MAATPDPPAGHPAPLERTIGDFAAVADAAPVPMWLTRADGTRGFVNRAYCLLVGLPYEEALLLDWRMLIHSDDTARAREQTLAGVASGETFSVEARYRSVEGGWLWFRSVSQPRAEGGGYVGVAHDITEAKDAEQALRVRERRLEFLDALAKATAAATDADAVMAITTRLLGERLGVSDCAYADMEADEDTFHIRGDWHAPGARSIVGTYSLAAFGSLAVANLRAGEPLIVNDNIAELGQDGAQAFLDIGIRATICMPFIKGDRLAALMAIHAATPRHWTDTELALLREVTQRSWAHVERVRAEAALRDSERQQRLAVEGTRIGTWDYDLRTRRGSWSPRSAEIMGVAHDAQLTQRERAELVHPDDRARIAEGTARLAMGGNDFAAEYRIVRPDGAVRWIASHGLIMRDEGGVAIRAIGTIRDVTVRREAQEALTALNATLEQQVAERTAERDRMWRLSRDLLLVIDLRRRIRAVNPAVAALGYTADEVLGQGLNGFIHPDDRAAANRAMRTVATAAIGEFSARLLAKDGGWRNFVWSAAPGEGEAYVIGRDTTAETARREELEQAQAALRQAQKVESLGQLTGGVAHDFNNLLTPIIGNLDLLGRRAGEDERQARLIRGALEAAERARTLVQRLLAFARRQPLQPGPVDLETLIASMASLVASTVGPQVEVVTKVHPNLPPARADENQLELAVLNLAVNARDAMPAGGELQLAAGLAEPDTVARAGLTGDFVYLCVADTGTGMDAGIAARAVEPFFSTKGVGKGTGLGLSMVHGLASQLGGAMLLTTAPGEGTRVELLLPVAEGTARTAAPAPVGSGEVGQAKRGRVLLVDDEEAVRDATAEMLASIGYEVATAASGEAALAMLDDACDYLVTDHLMPGIRGADLARRARGGAAGAEGARHFRLCRTGRNPARAAPPRQTIPRRRAGAADGRAGVSGTPSLRKWWERGVVYQVYPRSFMDSDGDGVGDLAGIEARVDYVAGLGVDAIWLSPIFPSPMADFGYDVADYSDIEPLFGTLADFDRLIARVHAAGLKLLLDFVPNHSSDRHPWFLESRRAKDSPKRDWYIWRDPAPDGGPPNNWISDFGGSAWEWDEGTGQYYLHAFLKQQPDLNWRNPDLKRAMTDVLRFWFDRGVDGFRIDVLWHIVKADGLPDNPVNPAWREGQNERDGVLQVHSTDQPEAHAIMAELRALADGYGADTGRERVLIGEIFLPNDRLARWFGTRERPEVHLPFNFALMENRWRADVLRQVIGDYEASLPDWGWPNWVIGSHDAPRIAGRLGEAQARVAAMLLLTLRGTPTLYQGDELGIGRIDIPPDRLRDPRELRQPGLRLGRDPARTPIAWNAGAGAGFSIAEPWLPLHDDWRTRNVAVQDADPASMLSLHRALLALRRGSAALTGGTLTLVDADDEVLAYERRCGDERVLVALNLGQRERALPEGGRVLLSTLGGSAAEVLRPDEGVIRLL